VVLGLRLDVQRRGVHSSRMEVEEAELSTGYTGQLRLEGKEVVGVWTIYSCEYILFSILPLL